MTQPPPPEGLTGIPSPLKRPPLDLSGAQDALSQISRMMVGTKALQDHPGLVYSLAQQQASPQDAQAIDQFLQSLEAEKRVALARAAGSKIPLSANEQTMLDANGVKYQDVMFTPQDQATQAADRIMAASGGTMTAKRNADGTLALDPNGQIQPVAVHKAVQEHGSTGGFLGGVANFFDSVGSGLKRIGGDALSGMSKALNFVQGALRNPTVPSVTDIVHGHTDPNWLVGHNTDYQDMAANGYDPTSVWSQLAFDASGKKQDNLTDLNNAYGQDKVDEAISFLNDPKRFRQNIENDPSNWYTGTDGRPALIPEAQAKLEYLASKDFRDLALRLNANKQDFGTNLANGLGIDPVNDAHSFAQVAGVGNFMAGFVIDPTLAAFKVGQEVKLAQVGIDGLADNVRAASILKGSGVFARNVQRGWQRAIDLGEQFRQATGNLAQQAAITAKATAELPALAPIWENFTGGEHIFQGYKDGAAVYGHSDGIRNLDEAAQFVENQWGMHRLVNGRAATQSGLMPGALSAVGYRKLKGLTAGWMTARSVNRINAAAAEVASRAEADPALAQKLLDDKVITRFQPEADNAINFHSGEVLADDGAQEAQGLASQQRGQFTLTPKGVGVVKQNLRATGDVLGDSTLGRFSPTAIKERARQAAIRLSTMLPRNTVIDINDPRAGETIYRMAMTYLNRGEANTLRSLWATGNSAQRKLLVHGLMDQVAHAAGFGKTEEGRQLIARMHTEEENYFSSGEGIVLNGQKVAGFEGQTRTRWKLPSFQEMQKAANRIGLYAPTLGRVMNSDAVDTIMSLWKFNALSKASTITRNLLEGWGRTGLEGRAGAAIRARSLATLRNEDVWRLLPEDAEAERNLYITTRGRIDTLTSELKGSDWTQAQRAEKTAELSQAKASLAGLEKKSTAVQHMLALEKGDTALAKQIAGGSMMSGQALGRSVYTERLAQTGYMTAIGRAFHALTLSHMDEATMRAALTYGARDLADSMEGYGLQLSEAELGWKNAAKQVDETARAGYGPSYLRFRLQRAKALREKGEKAPLGAVDAEGNSLNGTVWTHKALDNTVGADRYANALAQRVNAMPETSRAAIALLRLGDHGIGRGAALKDLVKALEDESKNTAFGHAYFPDIVNAPSIARDAASPEEVEAGKFDWANHVAQELKYLLTGQNGKFQEDLADYIVQNGRAPDAQWIVDHMKGDNRPESALAPTVMAMAPGGVQKLAEILQDVEGSAYAHFIERTLQRLGSGPVFLANYAIARRQLERHVDQLVSEAGFTQEAAENLAKELATRQSWVKTEQLIDDPGQKTQFDVVARNFFPFARATQAMIRRWGTGLWQNPVAARKMMLAYEGAVHSGLIYNNVYGEPTFTYPGSGILNLALRGLATVPGFENFARFPVAADMTGQVLMSVPGADNPFRMGMGPMISVPFREIYTQLLPYLHAHLGVPTANTQEGLAKIDALINGPIGTGETWVQFVPTTVRKFYVALNGDQRNSALASSMQGAIANLMAAGLAPAPGASDAEKRAFRSALQTQVKNQLFIRAVFGFFAPAAPSSPSEGTSKSGADYAWSIDGIKQLSDEYKSILNEVGGDVPRANVIFTTLHPDWVVYDSKGNVKSKGMPSSAYETFGSGSTTPGAYLPSTDSALHWLDSHAEFVNKYQSVAAYFLPTPTANEPYSDAARKAELEFGLRQRKTPEEFMKDIYTKHAESVFFPADQQINNMIAQARLNNDQALVNTLTQQRHDWETQFKALNPEFADKIDDYGTARKTARSQLSDLRQMVDKGEVPDGLGAQLTTVIKTYDQYEQFLNDHQGSNKVSTLARQHALATVNAWAAQELTGTPLEGVWNGVFRVLNSNLNRLGSTG